MTEFTIIGPAIMDVLVGNIDETVFKTGSQPIAFSRMSFGGDALNEAVVLSKFGKSATIITKLGNDEAGQRIQSYLQGNGIDTSHITIDDSIQTGMNIVLVNKNGERVFLTNPAGSLRKLSADDILPHIPDCGNIVCLASMFISPLLTIADMEEVCRQIKKDGRILALDMTTPKNGETIDDISEILKLADYVFPNELEISLLTHEKDPEKNAKRLVQAGVACAVIKCGGNGCIIRTKDQLLKIPAFPTDCVDSTGAGDCFAAGFLWALSEGMSLEECGCFACAVASCTVEQLGATDGIHDLSESIRRFYLLKKEMEMSRNVQ